MQFAKMENTLSDGLGSTSVISTSNTSSQLKKSSISVGEERELKRVYDRLCDYHVRSGINIEIKDLQSWQYAAKMKVKANLQNNILVDQNQVDSTHSATQCRIDELKQKLQELESNALKSISVNDISEMFKFLNKKLGKKDFEEMKEWVHETRFDRLGIFNYSHEENTHAYSLNDDVPDEVKRERASEIIPHG